MKSKRYEFALEATRQHAHHSTWTITASLLALIAVGGCSSEPTSSGPASMSQVQPQCQEGCQETDPSPSSPGIFLTSSTTPAKCEEGPMNDSDVDGLSDDCETRLAAAFAPELYTSGILDNTGRESRWAARLLQSGTIRVMYLLSYYNDAGSTFVGCPFSPSDCAPHSGDSEWNLLDIKYNATTHHWVLNSAEYSQHDGSTTYGSGGAAYPTVLYYPGKLGGYPRSYVAIGKHANYSTVTECNGGGFAGSDDCSSGSTASRVAAGTTLNIGSNSNHSGIGQNCVASSNPLYQYYGAGRVECYWTGARFRGWVPDSLGGGDADPYGPKLRSRGF